MNKLQKKYNILFPPKSHTQPGFYLSHGSLKAAQPPIGRRACHSQLHLPPTWWRFRTKVTRPVHYAHKRHNKSPCWEKWDPSAPKGHNNKFPSGSITHGPEPGTTTIIYLTKKKRKKKHLSLSPASSFPPSCVLLRSDPGGEYLHQQGNVYVKSKKQTGSEAANTPIRCRAGFTDFARGSEKQTIKKIGKKASQHSDTVALELASCSLFGDKNTFRRWDGGEQEEGERLRVTVMSRLSHPELRNSR